MHHIKPKRTFLEADVTTYMHKLKSGMRGKTNDSPLGVTQWIALEVWKYHVNCSYIIFNAKAKIKTIEIQEALNRLKCDDVTKQTSNSYKRTAYLTFRAVKSVVFENSRESMSVEFLGMAWKLKYTHKNVNTWTQPKCFPEFIGQ